MRARRIDNDLKDDHGEFGSGELSGLGQVERSYDGVRDSGTGTGFGSWLRLEGFGW